MNVTHSDQTSPDRIVFPLYLTYFAAISAVALSVIGVSGNLLTILALSKDNKLRAKATTSFIISLSVSDLLFCGFNLPLTAVRYFHQAWILGRVGQNFDQLQSIYLKPNQLGCKTVIWPTRYTLLDIRLTILTSQNSNPDPR